MISFRDLRTTADIVRWINRLNTDWPERPEVMAHMCDQLKGLPFPTPHIVELGCGPGLLAELLLTEIPHLAYTGLDSSNLLFNYAQQQLVRFGDRFTLIQADLNGDGWPELLAGQVHAVISMQSLHDLGGEVEVNRIYGMARKFLAPGGLFLNADLVVSPQQKNPKNPGRRTIPRHLELLRSHGYERVACTLEVGEFGCVMATAPDYS